MATLKELRQVRLDKLHKLNEMGIDAYPPNAQKDININEVVKDFDSHENKKYHLTGRIITLRQHGKLVFADIQDNTGKIQLYIKEDVLHAFSKEEQLLGFSELGLLDSGDFVEVFGTVVKTKKGEISLEVTKLRIISKALRPLPDKHFGLQDTEERYRRRYLDLIVNKDSKRVLDARWLIEKEIRKFLWNENFVEVETPVLQSLYGGTNAKPFVTHFNALGEDFYLRIAPELYLKRLMVGGYEKVFEIARNFRNEGIDQTHFPEFTMIEWYEAYADYHRVMDLAEALTKHLVKELTGGSIISVGDKDIDVGGKWPRVEIEELIKNHFGIDWDTCTEVQVKDLLKVHGVKVVGEWNKSAALFELFDHVIAPTLYDPIWVLDYPIAISPLSRAHRLKEGRAERFEGYIGGVEIFDGWSEIISGLEQRERFENEQKKMREGDPEAMPLDEEFLEALEHGCPPLGGIGFGIDRIVMFLTNTWAIKEVMAFPILKARPAEVSSDNNDHEDSEDPAEDHISFEGSLPTRKEASDLLEKHVSDDYQKMHAKMVAAALEAYAQKRNEDVELWYITGLLHDIDYFEFPDEHPNESINWFKEWQYPGELIHAVAAHAHMRTGVLPKTDLAAALMAVDELAGFLYAYSLMRPEGFEGMKPSSVKKKFKDKGFAAKIDRDEILMGVEKFNIDFDDHIQFMIQVLQKM